MLNTDLARFTTESYGRYIKTPAFKMKVGNKKKHRELQSEITHIIVLINKYIDKNEDIFEVSSEDSIKKLSDQIIKFHKIDENVKENVAQYLQKMFGNAKACIQMQKEVNEERLKRKTLLNDENIETFIERIYIPMMGNDALEFDGKLCVSDILKTKPASFFITEFSIDEMDVCIKKYGVVQLRKLNKEATKLVIGCGHDLIDLNIFPDVENLKDKINYNKQHEHVGQVTVDIDLMRNPDFLANYGKVLLSPIFEGHQFEEIIFEGFDPDMSKDICQDIINLLKPRGKILVKCGSKEDDYTFDFQETAYPVLSGFLF